MENKSLVTIIVVFLIICTLGACTSSKDNNLEKSNMHKLIIDESIDDIVLPNSNASKTDLKLSMPFSYNNLADTAMQSKIMLADLPFEDLPNDLLINNYNLGYLNIKDSTSFNITYVDAAKNESDQKEHVKKGNCLVISATDPSDGQNYLMVIDYVNDKYFFTKTELPWTDSICPAVDLVDLTGDGKHEIVTYVSSDDYKDGINFEVFRVESDSLKKIYSNIENEEAFFAGYLEDKYTATIKYDDIEFEEIIILTDVGYRLVDFELQDAPDDSEDDETSELRLFDNEKYTGEHKKNLIYNGKPTKVFGINYVKGDNGYKFEFDYPLYMGDWKGIGSALVWFDYDKSNDTMKPSGAYYKYIGNYAWHHSIGQ